MYNLKKKTACPCEIFKNEYFYFFIILTGKFFKVSGKLFDLKLRKKLVVCGVGIRDGNRVAPFLSKKIASNYRIETRKRNHIHYRITERHKKSAIISIFFIVSVDFYYFVISNILG